MEYSKQDLAFFLESLSTPEVTRLLAYLSGQAAFAREQTRLARDRAQSTDSAFAQLALVQCSSYLDESWDHLQLAMGELAHRPVETGWAH